MLEGEPGIGKTRIARALVLYAAKFGVDTFWGNCNPVEGAPPFWPWIQCLRSYVEEASPEQLITYMGDGAADIASMLPQLRDKLPDLKPLVPLEPDQARFRLLDSLTSFLVKTAQSQPMLLILEDLHWADKSSLSLLESVVKEIGRTGLLLIGTYREEEISWRHPLAQSLGSLSTEIGFSQLRLKGLRRAEIEDFIEKISGHKPSTDLVEMAEVRTQGNPLYLQEIFRLINAVTGEVTKAHLFKIPTGVKGIIGRRLDRLSVRTNRALVWASVIGIEFDFALLRHCCDLAEEELLDALDEALGSHIIEEATDQLETYRFSHVLIQQTILDDLSSSRKVRLHARIGDAIEQLSRFNSVEAYASELVHHYSQAISLLGPEKFVRYSLLAGEQALAANAFEEATNYFQRALEVRGEQQLDQEGAELLFGLGRAQIGMMEIQDIHQPFQNVRRAFNYFASNGMRDRASQIAEYPFFRWPGDSTGMIEILNEAIDLVTPKSNEWGRLHVQLGMYTFTERGDIEGTHDALGKALVVARQQDDKDLEIRALGTKVWADMLSLQDPLKGLDECMLVMRLAGHVNEPQSELVAQMMASVYLFVLGQRIRAGEMASRALALAEQARGRSIQSKAFWLMETFYRYHGDWEEAREFSEKGLSLTPLDPFCLGTRAVLEHQIGEPEKGNHYLNQLIKAMELVPPGPTIDRAYTALVIPLITWISGDDSLLEMARVLAKAVANSQFAAGYPAMAANLALTIIMIIRQDIEGAKLQYENIPEVLKATKGAMIKADVNTGRVFGLAAHLIGKTNESVAQFEEALACCRRGDYRPELAWTCYDYAETLLHRNGPGEHARATLLLDESLAISSELGMKPLTERVIALQERVQSHRANTPAYPDGLTQREVEVLLLIALGKSNSEVADELVLSVRTVERHISNIYAKINARGRADATSYALSHKLTC